jgi:ABC-type sugar transport system permease subunit
MFDSIIVDETITLSSALICTLVSLLLGFIIAMVYKFKSNYTKNFLITLTLLPVIVQMVIMMVNGNIGTGVAVLGAFSLIRFRSVAGNSKDICIIFLAMAVGLATGMGYVGFAVIFVVIVCAVFIVLKLTNFGEEKGGNEKTLKITVPEDLDYTKSFTEVFKTYASKVNLEKVKTQIWAVYMNLLIV